MGRIGVRVANNALPDHPRAYQITLYLRKVCAHAHSYLHGQHVDGLPTPDKGKEEYDNVLQPNLYMVDFRKVINPLGAYALRPRHVSVERREVCSDARRGSVKGESLLFRRSHSGSSKRCIHRKTCAGLMMPLRAHR